MHIFHKYCFYKYYDLKNYKLLFCQANSVFFNVLKINSNCMIFSNLFKFSIFRKIIVDDIYIFLNINNNALFHFLLNPYSIFQRFFFYFITLHSKIVSSFIRKKFPGTFSVQKLFLKIQ